MTKRTKIIGGSVIALVIVVLAVMVSIVRPKTEADIAIPLPFGFDDSSSSLVGSITPIGVKNGISVQKVLFPEGTDAEVLSMDSVYLVTVPDDDLVDDMPLDQAFTLSGSALVNYFGYKYSSVTALAEKTNKSSSVFTEKFPGQFFVSAKARAEDAQHGNAIATFEANNSITMAATDTLSGALLSRNSLYFLIVNEASGATLTVRHADSSDVITQDVGNNIYASETSGTSCSYFEATGCQQSVAFYNNALATVEHYPAGFTNQEFMDEVKPLDPSSASFFVKEFENNVYYTWGPTTFGPDTNQNYRTYLWYAGGKIIKVQFIQLPEDFSDFGRMDDLFEAYMQKHGSDLVDGVYACGNSAIETGETCDDSDADSGDGCSNVCAIESGYSCTGEPSVCTLDPVCGNGDIEAGETCDDSDTDAGDGCSATCAVESGFVCSGEPSSCHAVVCGDGTKEGSEACDDTNTTDGDGCSATCTVESGFACTGSAPSTCAGICGDGLIKGSEACDDANTANDDGCSNVCAIEGNFSCTGTPSVCTNLCGNNVCSSDETAQHLPGHVGAPYYCPQDCNVCGDGVIHGSETCDDNDTDAGDGCSATCDVEAGFSCIGEPSVCTPM